MNFKRALIIPFHNFEDGLPATLSHLKEWLGNQSGDIRIYFVDDSSTDRTLGLLEKFANENRGPTGHETFFSVSGFTGRGKGAAIRAGFTRAARDGADQIAFTDCDLHYGLDIISEKIFPALEANDIVILDRAWRAGSQHPSFLRQLSSGIFNRFVALLTGVAFRDTQAGLKGFRVASCKALFDILTIEGFAFDVEVLSIALFYRLRIMQIPVVFADGYEHPGGSTVNLLSSSFTMILDLFRINWNWKRNRYHHDVLEAAIDSATYRIQL